VEGKPKSRQKCRSWFFYLVCVFSLLAGCQKVENKDIKEVDLSVREPVRKDYPQSTVVSIGVAAMISPAETFKYYIRLVDYVGEKLGMPVKLIQKKTYKEMNELVEAKKVDFALVCSGPYTQGRKKFGMELLAAPLVHGESVYYAYTIVYKDDPIERFEQLEGKTFGFTDPHSNTGYIVPTYMLKKLGRDPRIFFKKTIFTASHDNSIRAVAERLVDAASVDSLIYDYMKIIDPLVVAHTKILVKSPPFGMPPMVCNPGIEAGLKNKVKDILLHMHEEEKGKAILQGILIDRFIVVGDSLYDSIREMQDAIDGQKE
jgi:phosphonate transport system substrate-binding protein